MTEHYVLAAVLVAAVATLATRALPFVALARHQNHPLLQYLGKRLPAAVIIILVLYSLRDAALIQFADHEWQWQVGANGWPLLAASLLVALLHIWKRNVLFSIIAGTGLYMTLIQSGF